MTFAREKVCNHAACDVSPADLRRRTLRSRASLCLENLALRHQVAIYKQTIPRPRLHPTDRPFWAWLSRLWSGWQEALALVQPRTRIAWQRQRFRDHWRRLSQQGRLVGPPLPRRYESSFARCGRRTPTWGSPRIVGELRKLGIDVATSTVEKYRPRPRKPPVPNVEDLPQDPYEDVVALDFFVVPTVTFRVLFVLVILAHERRRIVHVNVTEHPTAQWTAQQVVEAFPGTRHHAISCAIGTALRPHFRQRVRHMGIK